MPTFVQSVRCAGASAVVALLASACVTRSIDGVRPPPDRDHAAVAEVDGQTVRADVSPEVRDFAVEAGQTLSRSGDRGVERLVRARPEVARALVELHWPGPVTQAVEHALATVCAADARCERSLELAAACAAKEDARGVRAHVADAASAAYAANDPRTLERVLTLAGLSADQTWRLNERLADLRTQRGEYFAAIGAYDRAAQSAGPEKSSDIQFRRARALRLDGSAAECELSLAELAAGPDPIVARRARALLGVIAAERGNLTQALGNFDAALQGGDDTWPGAGAARADRGVVLLRMDRQDLGLAELERAAAIFEAQGDTLGLVRTLRNRAACLRSQDREGDAEPIEARVRVIEDQNGLAQAE